MEKEKESMDLSTKYQRLATEFAKIRAQGNVLKKAVLDEQAKNAKLKDDFQAKDQTLRKLEQEMDSISFRNTQLEKRVGFLQDELTNITNAGKGKKTGSKKKDKEVVAEEAASANTGIFDYELLSKIDENIQLHKQISDLEENHRREVMELKLRLEEKQETEERIKKESLDHLRAEAEEKLSLTHSLQSALDENEAYRDQVEQLQEKILSFSAFQSSGNPLTSRNDSGSTGRDSDNANGSIKQGSIESGLEDSNDIFDRLLKSEQSKEHWLIEYQLFKMKYSKTLKKLDEAKAILKSLGKDYLLNEEATPIVEANPGQLFTTLIGQMELSAAAEDSETRDLQEEKEVNKYLQSRINDLIALIQLANSKAITFQSECSALENLLALNVQNKLDVDAKYAEAIEELQLTKQNYEAQLSTMTEHIANLNDQMLAQKESIEELTYALTNKAATKSKK